MISKEQFDKLSSKEQTQVIMTLINNIGANALQIINTLGSPTWLDNSGLDIAKRIGSITKRYNNGEQSQQFIDDLFNLGKDISDYYCKLADYADYITLSIKKYRIKNKDLVN